LLVAYRYKPKTVYVKIRKSLTFNHVILYFSASATAWQKLLQKTLNTHSHDPD